MEDKINLKIEKQKELNRIADELDLLQKIYAKKYNLDGDIIEYVNWIVQDLRKGDLEKAKADYNNQSDKYSDKLEIKKFLQNNGIAEKGVDWSEWKKH